MNHEQAALAKLRKDTETDLAKAHASHRAMIERELADHKKAIAAAQTELEAAKKQAAFICHRRSIGTCSSHQFARADEQNRSVFEVKMGFH
jgi:hypothetical protein